MDNSLILRVEKLNVKFGQYNHVVKDLDFSVNKGEVIAIIGPNGAGKSVLFKTLLGLIPYSGKIEWSSNFKIGYVPQNFIIDKDIPLSVNEFLRLKTRDHKQILNALETVGVISHSDYGPTHHHEHPEHILNHRLGWLSGGQMQRILIAWALIDNPDVLLFDEPTAGIDIGGEETIYNLLKRLHDERGMTTLLISHDLHVVYKYADTVLCLNKEKVCFGMPATVLDPGSLAKLYGEAGFYQHNHDE